MPFDFTHLLDQHTHTHDDPITCFLSNEDNIINTHHFHHNQNHTTSFFTQTEQNHHHSPRPTSFELLTDQISKMVNSATTSSKHTKTLDAKALKRFPFVCNYHPHSIFPIGTKFKNLSTANWLVKTNLLDRKWWCNSPGVFFFLQRFF